MTYEEFQPFIKNIIEKKLYLSILGVRRTGAFVCLSIHGGYHIRFDKLQRISSWLKKGTRLRDIEHSVITDELGNTVKCWNLWFFDHEFYVGR